MGHTVKVGEHVRLEHCPDCGSEHMHAPCGMTYVQRLCSVRLDTSVTATRTKKNYYDQGPIDEIFGESADERMMDETEGFGVVTPEELAARPDLEQDIAAYYGADDRDAKIISGG